MIKHYEKKSDILTLTSLFLGISSKLSQYKQVIGKDVPCLYFEIFQELTIHSPQDKKFDIWNPYTSITKIKSKAVEDILSRYFSKVKIMYIQMKIQEFINLMQNERSGNSLSVVRKSFKSQNKKKLSDPLSAKYINPFT